MVEKRDAERIPVPGELTGEVTVFQRMSILDISEQGAQIETAFKLQLDSLHDFRLSVDGRSLVLKGRIVYCRIGELGTGGVLYRSGVEFVEVPPHVGSALADFVEARRAAKSRAAVLDAEIAEDGA